MVKRYDSLVRRIVLAAPILQLLVLPELSSGCARRFDLTPAELARVETADGTPIEGSRAEGDAAVKRPGPELARLRVYLDRRLRSYYPQEEVPVEFKVETRKLSERGAARPRVRRISRRVPGMVIAEDTQGQMRRLWVTFSKACDRPACAYAFVETELGRYSMVMVPRLETYKEPRSYRRTRLRRNLMRQMWQRSLTEANQVLAVPRRSGTARTIDLQVRKDRRRPTWRDPETLRGVGY